MVHTAQPPCRSPVGYGKENVRGKGNEGGQGEEKRWTSAPKLGFSLHLGSLSFPFFQILACCHHTDCAETRRNRKQDASGGFRDTDP